ncbi:MAG: hypothetical protein RLZZ555_2167 [Pseudomonadota bacterium]|jgi:hypothetical protein
MPLTRQNVLSAISAAPVRLLDLSPSRHWKNPRRVEARQMLTTLTDEGLIRLIYLCGQQRYALVDWQPSADDIRLHLDGYIKQVDGCMEWTGGLSESGAPTFKMPGDTRRQLHVRRWLYQQLHGEQALPAGIQLLPVCGNDRCVDLSHLRKRKQNQWQRGKVLTLAQRAAIARGTRRWRGNFAWDDIVAIRASDESNAELGIRYGCSAALIGQIKRHEIWREYVAGPFTGLLRAAANDQPASRRKTG